MNQENKFKYPVSVAPMMDWTDRHCRYFHRLLSPTILLYTEMVTSSALIHGDRERFLRFSNEEHPIALQLGGSDPQDLALCAQMGEDKGYDEINLNCGCPSDRVQKGKIGAILMAEPDLVANCVEKIKATVKIPVTVKCRIGIDDMDSYEFLDEFVSTIKGAGCDTFIIHARKAWLNGLSPKENRTKPEINYARVAEVKSNHPELQIIVNGEIKTIEDVRTHLETFDGVMIGREAYQNPSLLGNIEQEILGNCNIKDKASIARAMIPYAIMQKDNYGTPLKSITRHMTGLFQSERGAKKWRQLLSTLPHEENAKPEIIDTILQECELG